VISDVDHRAVADAVLPDLRHPAADRARADALQQGIDVGLRPDLGDAHLEELVAAPAVVAHGGGVDGEELQRLGVVDPGRDGTGLEQHAVARVAAQLAV
jgi:hypothetical protein